MGKELEPNKDWIARDHGRIPSKGRQAAERASAGLGTTDDDSALGTILTPRPALSAKPAAKPPAPGKP
jgi:hypothetical protein